MKQSWFNFYDIFIIFDQANVKCVVVIELSANSRQQINAYTQVLNLKINDRARCVLHHLDYPFFPFIFSYSFLLYALN